MLFDTFSCLPLSPLWLPCPFFSSPVFPCFLFSCTLVYWWSSSFVSFLSFVIWGATCTFWWIIVAFFKERWELCMLDGFSMQQLGLLLLPCITHKQIKTAGSLIVLIWHVLSIIIDCVSGPNWIHHSVMPAIRLCLLFLLIFTDTASIVLFFLSPRFFSLFLPICSLVQNSSTCSLFVSLSPTLYVQWACESKVFFNYWKCRKAVLAQSLFSLAVKQHYLQHYLAFSNNTS